ncbi:MAG: cytidine deaminase [Anaerolineae bacterium]
MNGKPENQPAALIQEALTVYDNAYAPYSHYKVAAAVLADDGNTYTGVNVENAVYPLTMCAERVAVFNAVASGAKRILALAVVTENAGSPCGACRQVMREFGSDDLPVYVSNVEGQYRTRTLAQLLPEGFSADDLHRTKAP